MTSKGLGRLACGAILPFIAVVFLEAGATVTAGCGDSSSCMSTRQTTFDLLQSWEKCTPGDPDSCIIEPGNPKDCTGVLTCPFAINPASRMAAEGQMLVMGEQSRGCYQCSVPSCLAGNIPICEPVSKHCYIVESIIGDAAIITPGGGSNDAGGLSSIDNDASP